MFESVGAVRARYGTELYAAEWAFTILFTVEIALAARKVVSTQSCPEYSAVRARRRRRLLQILLGQAVGRAPRGAAQTSDCPWGATLLLSTD
jgi:hypothetical protein